MVTLPALTSKTRVVPPPLTVIWLAPGPLTVRSSVMAISLASVMVPCSPLAKSTLSAPGWALAWPTAHRSEPVPLSARLVTVKVLGTVRSSRAVSHGTKGRRGRRARVSRLRSGRHPRGRSKKASNIGYLGVKNGSAVSDSALLAARRPGAQGNARG